MCLYVVFFVDSVCFPLSNLVCFIIVKALKQEIEILKEEIGNAQLEKAHQVKSQSHSMTDVFVYMLFVSALKILFPLLFRK